MSFFLPTHYFSGKSITFDYFYEETNSMQPSGTFKQSGLRESIIVNFLCPYFVSLYSLLLIENNEYPMQEV